MKNKRKPKTGKPAINNVVVPGGVTGSDDFTHARTNAQRGRYPTHV